MRSALTLAAWLALGQAALAQYGVTGVLPPYGVSSGYGMAPPYAYGYGPGAYGSPYGMSGYWTGAGAYGAPYGLSGVGRGYGFNSAIGYGAYGTSYYSSAYSAYLAPAAGYYGASPYATAYPGAGFSNYRFGYGFGPGVGAYAGGGLGSYGYVPTSPYMGLNRPMGGLVRVPR